MSFSDERAPAIGGTCASEISLSAWTVAAVTAPAASLLRSFLREMGITLLLDSNDLVTKARRVKGFVEGAAVRSRSRLYLLS
jgi:hypothetical protein